eukprot:m.251797 g.251797  ORF g.251797 m.251797 type:complete len:373 (-) comp17413_c0_seq1:2765-3883(-)
MQSYEKRERESDQNKTRSQLAERVAGGHKIALLLDGVLGEDVVIGRHLSQRCVLVCRRADGPCVHAGRHALQEDCAVRGRSHIVAARQPITAALNLGGFLPLGAVECARVAGESSVDIAHHVCGRRAAAEGRAAAEVEESLAVRMLLAAAQGGKWNCPSTTIVDVTRELACTVLDGLTGRFEGRSALGDRQRPDQVVNDLADLLGNGAAAAKPSIPDSHVVREGLQQGDRAVQQGLVGRLRTGKERVLLDKVTEAAQQPQAALGLGGVEGGRDHMVDLCSNVGNDSLGHDFDERAVDGSIRGLVLGEQVREPREALREGDCHGQAEEGAVREVGRCGAPSRVGSVDLDGGGVGRAGRATAADVDLADVPPWE